MSTLGVIVASTRPKRVGGKVARWVIEQIDLQPLEGSEQFEGSEQWDVRLLDLAEIDLPLLDEDVMPAEAQGVYQHEHSQEWSRQITECDAVLIVTPQYNMSFPAAIKNAIDYLYAEWEAKPVGFVGYGWSGASESIKDLTKVLTRVKANVVGSVSVEFTKHLEPDGTIIDGAVAGSQVRDLAAELQQAALQTADRAQA